MRRLPSPPVQLITGAWRDLADLRRRVEAALRGGIRWVQLRAKERSAIERHEAAAMLAPRLREAGALFVVNGDIDLALAAGAGGVHLPESGMRAEDARRLLGEAAWIARSVHSVEGVREAGAAGAIDAVQFGPVFDTPSKRVFGEPQGIEKLAPACEAAREAGVALVAVGGLDVVRARRCLVAGAAAVSVIGAIWDAPDVEAAASEWLRP